MAFLLTARFNSTGPTNTDIIDFGGVSYTEASPLRDGNRCAYFYPLNPNSGLRIINNTKDAIASHLYGAGNAFTFYCKYKIPHHCAYNYPILPFVTYIGFVNDPMCLIGIEEGRLKYTTEYKEHFSENISYTFDNEWHTLCVSKNGNYVKMFVDGFLQLTFYDDGVIPILYTPYIDIGYYDISRDRTETYNFNGGYLDDICFTTDEVYSDNFVCPNLYWLGNDTKYNYYLVKDVQDLAVTNTDQMPGYLVQHTEKNMHSGAYRINERQKQWLPYRLDLTWHEEVGYMRKREWFRILDKRKDYTCIKISGLEQPLLMETENPDFVDYFIAEEALEKKQIYAFMLFVDKVFIKLSDIVIIKSDNTYTLFIDRRDQDPYDRVQSVEMVLIPFPVIYEEGLGQREDITPLYVFDEDGKFAPNNGYTYYYIDPDAGSQMYTTGILEQNIPIINQTHMGYDQVDGSNSANESYLDGGTDREADYLHSYWRYGTFQLIASGTTTCMVKFNSSDNSIQAQVGDKINLFKNTLHMDTRVYDILSTDTFRFYKDTISEFDLINRHITMQIITDARVVNDIRTDFIEMKEITIKATQDNQAKFTIPTATDGDGKPYHNFIVFKEGYTLLGYDRFKLSADKTYMILNSPTDFLQKEDTLTFIFLKCLKADQYGPLHVKPFYLWTKTAAPAPGFTAVTEVKIPSFRNLEYNINNVMMFVNGTFVTPDRYDIVDNVVKLKDTTYDRWIAGKDVVFVLLKMVNELEDPTGQRGQIIDYQQKQGARFVLYDLNSSDNCGDEDAWAKGALTKWNKITLDNFVVFDQNGEYLPEIIGEVFNMNIIKYIKSSTDPMIRVPRYLTCVYSPRSLKNTANVIIPDNFKFIKDYIRLYQDWSEMDVRYYPDYPNGVSNYDKFYDFISDFDTRYSRSKWYGQNLAKAFYYEIYYNELLFLDLYKKRANVKRLTLDRKKINSSLSMERDEFQDMAHRTYTMFFVDGMLPTWQKDVTYNMNRLYLKSAIPGNDSTVLECLRFKQHNNFLYSIQ